MVDGSAKHSLNGNRLRLIGSFTLLSSGHQVGIPHSVERLVAFVALAGTVVARNAVAGTLWPDVNQHRTVSNLRTALWRVQAARPGLVTTTTTRMQLGVDVQVDRDEFQRLARALVAGPDDSALARWTELLAPAELLPDWDDAWVVADRERLHLLHVEALETAAIALVARERFADAMLAARKAVELEPLRESARRIVIQVDIARGNVADALRCYHDYRTLLHAEFGVPPSPAMERIIAAWRPGRAAVTAR